MARLACHEGAAGVSLRRRRGLLGPRWGVAEAPQKRGSPATGAPLGPQP